MNTQPSILTTTPSTAIVKLPGGKVISSNTRASTLTGACNESTREGFGVAAKITESVFLSDTDSFGDVGVTRGLTMI